MKEFRCRVCHRLLAKIDCKGKVEIKCSRCKLINLYDSETEEVILQGSCSETVYKISKEDLNNLKEDEKKEFEEILDDERWWSEKPTYYSEVFSGDLLKMMEEGNKEFEKITGNKISDSYGGNLTDDWKYNDPIWKWICIYQSDLPNLQRFLEKNNIRYKGNFWLCYQYPSKLEEAIGEYLIKKVETTKEEEGEVVRITKKEDSEEISKICNEIINTDQPGGLGLEDLSVDTLTKKIVSIQSRLVNEDDKINLIKKIIKAREDFLHEEKI